MGMNLHWFWFEDPDGQPSITLSFMIVSFAIVGFRMLFGGTEFHLPWFIWKVQLIDGTTIGALLGVTFGSYVGRRYTDVKFDTDGDGVPDSPTPKKP